MVIHGYSGIIWVSSSVYTDTQTHGVSQRGHPWIVQGICGYMYSDTGGLAMGGHPRIVQDTLGILGVRIQDCPPMTNSLYPRAPKVYSEYPRLSKDVHPWLFSPPVSEYPRTPRILRVSQTIRGCPPSLHEEVTFSIHSLTHTRSSCLPGCHHYTTTCTGA